MTDRALVLDAATGTIKRKVLAAPAQLAAQVKAGESLFVLIGDDGQVIDDANIVVSEEGDLAPAAGAPEGTTAPTYELAYVPV